MDRSIPITLDGREFNLSFGINAMSEASQILRKDLTEILNEMRIGDIRILLWACLLRDNKKMTLDQVGDLMERYVEKGGKLVEIEGKVLDAILVSGLFRKREGNGVPEAASEPTSGSGLRTPSETPTDR